MVLEIPLAVTAVATAVKDIVEVGQKIHGSFAKVSDNYVSAKRVMDEIQEMVEQVEVFYGSHKDTLDDMNDFRLALQGLLDKFRNFETSALPFLPQMSGRKWNRFIRGWDAWRNNNKIERSLLDLQNDLVKVMRKYIWKSTMRTEIKLEGIHRQASRGLMGITKGLEVLEDLQRDVCAIRMAAAASVACSAYESPGVTIDKFNRSIVVFAQSTPSASAPMLHTPDMITEELLANAYIKFHINSIGTIIEKAATLPMSTPRVVDEFRISSAVEPLCQSTKHLRRHVVRELTTIQDLLDTLRSVESISMQCLQGAFALQELAVRLEILDMGEESILVGNWSITLVERLVLCSSEDPDYDLRASLALYRLNQSARYDQTGEKIQGLLAIEGANAIIQDLLVQSGRKHSFQALYSNILLQHARLVNNDRSIKMCSEAIRILEGMLDIQTVTRTSPPGTIGVGDVRLRFPALDQLFLCPHEYSSIMIYSRALRYLGEFLSKDDANSAYALDVSLLAVAVDRKLAYQGSEHRVDLALSLSSLVQGDFAGHIPAEDLVDLANECIQLLRELADNNPSMYAQHLVDVLWVKAETQQKLNRDTEAITTWEEVANLAEQILQDSRMCATVLGHLSDQFRRLERHEDAVRTGKLAITTHQANDSRALRYLSLSQDLKRLRRFEESADAARSSVALYRQLAMCNPERWMASLAKGLSHLARCAAVLGEYTEASMAWTESASMLDKWHLGSKFGKVQADDDTYLETLIGHLFLSFILVDEEELLKLCSITMRHVRRLSELSPANVDIVTDLQLQVEGCFAYNLYRIGHHQVAQQRIENWLDAWIDKPGKQGAMSDSEFADWRVFMVNLKADVLDAQGYTEKALLAIQEVHRVSGLSVSTYEPISEEKVRAIVHEARLQVDVGNLEKALHVAEGSQQRLIRENEPNIVSLMWAWYGVAFTAFSCQNYKRAAEAAREGCSINRSSNWEGNEFNIFLRPSLIAILASAEANLGNRGIALEYAHRAVDESLEIRDRKADISATTAERSYMETRGNLADILLGTGNLVQARQICEERKAYFTKQVERRMGEYRDLAPILRMLGILCCSEGRHEEGDAAAQELARILKTLGSAFPSLQEQVKIRLRCQTHVPILRVLNEMSERLECTHQAKVLSLFEI